MNLARFDEILTSTLADRRFSRNEKRALQAVLDEQPLDGAKLSMLLARTFEHASGQLDSSSAREILAWCEGVTKALVDGLKPASDDVRSEAWFSPGDSCLERLISCIDGAGRSIDVCVYTITDNRIRNALLRAHERRVKIRVISDNEKSLDEGSDILFLEQAGVAVAVDRSEHHMHHKFALFDGRLLATGSYNWTRSAAEVNAENVLLTGHERLVHAYSEEFERLWQRLARSRPAGPDN